MRFLSVCSGIEAASVAWEPLGWKAVGFSEIEPFPCAVLAHRFPNTPNHGSLTEYASWPIAPGSIDLLVGGTPCQSFSVAGLRKGMADPRGNLALVFLGLADRVKPRWIVWENVPGVLSSNGGRDFGSFLGALEQLGYGWAYRVLDAQHVGRCRMHAQGSGWDAVPQRRRRVFVVACLGAGGWESAAKVLFEPESLSGDTAKGRKKGQGVAADAQGGAGAGGLPDTVVTLCADTHPGAYSGQDAYTGRLIPSQAPADSVPFRKSKRAQSTTDDESWVEAGEANTLNNFDLGDTRTTHAVVGPPVAIQGTIIGRGENAGPQGTGATEGGPMFTLTKTDIHGVAHAMPGNVAPTVTSSGPPYSRTGNERVEADALAITFQPGNLRREAGADPSTTTTTTLKASAGDQMPHVAYCAEVTGTLTVGHHSCAGHQHRMGDNSFLIGDQTPHIANPVVPLDGMNLLSRLGKCGEEHSMQNFNPNEPQFTLRKGGSQHGVLTPMAVRRLTPTECMRLQGFPDDWARIPWKGKPADQCPDGPQYKAAGNSMAVPVMRWIGCRIAAVEQLSNQPTK